MLGEVKKIFFTHSNTKNLETFLFRCNFALLKYVLNASFLSMDGGDFTSENHFRFPLVLFETSFRFPRDCNKRIWKKSMGQNVEFEFGGKKTNIWIKTSVK